MTPAKLQVAPGISPGANPANLPPEVVDPIWLLKALALCVVAALMCGYATLCLLFYQGRWQLVLHPSRVIDRTPASISLPYSDVRFDATETGQPRLTAWWISASNGQGFEPRYADYTILYLHDGTGSLSDTLPMLARLHSAGLNVFAIDYRGFGASDSAVHPSQERMLQDCVAALDYLKQTRHISTRAIVPYGVGLGASLAVKLANSNPDLPALILDNPDPDPASTAVAAHPSAILPVRLLFGGQFNMIAPLESLSAPKLLIAGGPNAVLRVSSDELQTLFKRAKSPSFAVTLPSRDAQVYQSALTRFLDEYLPPPTPTGSVRSEPVKE